MIMMKTKKMFKTLLKDLSEGYLSKAEKKLVEKLRKKLKAKKEKIKELKTKIKKLKDNKKKLKAKISEMRTLIVGLQDQIERMNGNKYPSPEVKGEISNVEAKEKLKNFSPAAQIWLSDGNYGTTSKAEILKFLEINDIDKREYIHPRHDCDDFSYELMGAVSSWNSHLAFGIIWGRQHAFNFFIDHNHKIYAVEPQTDVIYPIEKYIKPEETWLLIM